MIELTPGLQFACGCIVTEERQVRQCGHHRPAGSVSSTAASPRAIPDLPDTDGTDAAHPAWWRGHIDGSLGMVRVVERLLDEGGSGHFGHPAVEAMAHRILALRRTPEQPRSSPSAVEERCAHCGSAYMSIVHHVESPSFHPFASPSAVPEEAQVERVAKWLWTRDEETSAERTWDAWADVPEPWREHYGDLARSLLSALRGEQPNG